MARGTLDLGRIPGRERLMGGPGWGRGRRREDSLFHPRAPAAWKHVDLVLLGCAAAISALGALMILSSTRGTDPDAYDLSYLRRQVLFIGIGVVGMVLVTLVDYRRLRDFAWLPYLAMVLALGLVLSPLGTERRGTQAWFQLGPFQLQPAELAKVGTIFAMAVLLARFEPPLSARRLLLGLALCAVPVALILAQPDLGTALVFVAIVGVLNSDLLEDYQRDRLTEFLDQDQGLEAETYNLDQSKAAIASGAASGKGLFEGTQTRLGFVPEQHTDFIFTALGEELGFAGSATLLALFALMCVRILRTAQIAHDRLGTLICGGVLSLLVFQVFQNVGMTMGIMPITGITLPFMSYGGSSVVASWLAVGLVLNVHMRRFG